MYYLLEFYFFYYVNWVLCARFTFLLFIHECNTL